MAPSEDGLGEAVYLLNGAFAWGVQWHPEVSFPTEKTARGFSLHLARLLPLRGAVQGTLEVKQTITPL